MALGAGRGLRMTRHPCCVAAALAGGQAWRDGRGRQAVVSCRLVTGGGRHRLSRQAAHPLSQPCPRGAEIIGGVLGKWPAWPVEELALGCWRGVVQAEGLHCPWVWGDSLSPPPSLLPLPRIRVPRCWGHTAAAAPYPGQQQPGPPPPSNFHVARASYSSQACVSPHLCCVWDTHADAHMHPCTYTHMLDPKGPRGIC